MWMSACSQRSALTVPAPTLKAPTCVPVTRAIAPHWTIGNVKVRLWSHFPLHCMSRIEWPALKMDRLPVLLSLLLLLFFIDLLKHIWLLLVGEARMDFYKCHMSWTRYVMYIVFICLFVSCILYTFYMPLVTLQTSFLKVTSYSMYYYRFPNFLLLADFFLK